jgi:N-acetylglucosaminyldiphosphoundecaprenol N-acetyl-beta-D-mannosaminyltransferase
MQHDPELRRIVDACELVSADGQSVVWASRLLGDPLPERVAGIDLMQELLALAERRGFRVFILGAKPEVLEMARRRILAQHPRLQLVGTRDGYFSEAEAEEAKVAEEIRDARPDILFVAMSSPRKEYWLARYGRTIDVPFVMGVGGAIDVVAGITQRAPGPFQRLGLEWAYRLAQEPAPSLAPLPGYQLSVRAASRRRDRAPVGPQTHTSALRSARNLGLFRSVRLLEG